MKNRNIFFCFLAVSLFVVSFAFNASAQTRDRKAITNSTETTTTARGESRLQNEPVIISEAEPEEAPKTKAPAPLSLPLFKQLLQAAIDTRIGARYRYGSQGPRTFDCSGFVWSVFQEAGINFDRGSARTLWARYQAPTEEEKYKFGTLVFFNRLGHVGIVVDENGFYHASTSKGVMYSRFDDYWTKRLVGFRRVPLITATETTAKK
jgi:cell wall-associated NlpC family hydrolase